MDSYYVVVKQAGEGCDYTIGCGLAMWKLDAANHAEAVAEARALYEESYENELASMKLVTSSQDLPVHKWRGEVEQARAAAKAAKSEAAERAELERLQARFGDRSSSRG